MQVPVALYIILLIAAVYLLIGLLFALWFVFFRLYQFDPGTREGGIGLKLLLLPASTALWPVLAIKITNKSDK